MPETVEARQRVLDFMEEKGASYSQLALMSGYKKNEIHAALTGDKGTPKSNEIILKLIQMFGLN